MLTVTVSKIYFNFKTSENCFRSDGGHSTISKIYFDFKTSENCSPLKIWLSWYIIVTDVISKSDKKPN